MTTCVISAFFLGTSSAQAVAAGDLVEQCPSAVSESICQLEPARKRQRIEKGAVTSGRGSSKMLGKRVMLWLHSKKYNILCFSKLCEIKCRPFGYYISILKV